jgi:hypothetical protein
MNRGTICYEKQAKSKQVCGHVDFCVYKRFEGDQNVLTTFKVRIESMANTTFTTRQLSIGFSLSKFLLYQMMLESAIHCGPFSLILMQPIITTAAQA